MTPEVVEVASGVFFVEATDTNFVLLTDGQEITLVDSGFPADRELIEAAVTRTGGSMADVAAVVLTHGHRDHLGSAEWLRTEHDVVVRCHELEAAHVRGTTEERIAEWQILVRLWRPAVLRHALRGLRAGFRHVQWVKEVSTIADGEALDVPARPVAVHTPGHTSGHIGLHLADRGVLITGDALVTLDLWDATHRGPQLLRRPFNHDHRQAIESLARFESLDADVVLPGHGAPHRSSPAQAVALARRDTR